MLNLKKIILPIIALGFMLSGCAIRLPKITATGERTVFENQIVGSYKMIEEEAWMVASLRSDSPDSLQIAEEKRKVLEAILRQKFNADDIEDFKLAEIAGEKNSGYLTIRDTEYNQADSSYRALIDKIVSEENGDRRLIMNRLIELNPEIAMEERERIGVIYSKMKQESSPKGTWIQNENDEWRKK